MTNIANTLTLRNPESISEKTSATALKRSLLLLIGCVLIVNSPLTFAEIYKWVDENGKVHYGDKPKDEQSKKLEIKKNTSTYTTPSNKRSAASRSVLNRYKNKQEAFFAAAAEKMLLAAGAK